MEEVFASGGHWYRGNMHMHSTESDGKLPPDQAAAWYQERGYDFIVMTDHRKTIDVSGFGGSGFLVIPGMELDCVDHDRGASYHIVGIGIEPFAQPEESRRGPGQALVDQIRAAGGQALLAHPYWLGQDVSDLKDIVGAFGIEVYNATCGRSGKENGAVHWDMLLERGVKVWGAATDDAHGYDLDAGLGWVMVKADALDPQAIAKALAEGHFYASQGPAFVDMRVQDGVLRVHTSPAKEIRFIANGGRGRVVQAPPGELITAASQPLANRKYVRVEVVDIDGKRAWSQPVFTE